MATATNNEGFVFLSTTPHSSFWSEECFAHQNINGRDRNEEGEMKAIFTLHCYFAFPMTAADRRGKQVSSTAALHFPLLRADFLSKPQKKNPKTTSFQPQSGLFNEQTLFTHRSTSLFSKTLSNWLNPLVTKSGYLKYIFLPLGNKTYPLLFQMWRWLQPLEPPLWSSLPTTILIKKHLIFFNRTGSFHQKVQNIFRF